MRCLSCDRRLNDRESVRKYASTGTFVDLCNRCFSYVADDIPDIDDGIDIDIGADEYDEPTEADKSEDYQQFGYSDDTESESRS